jgi:hypothetical protein
MALPSSVLPQAVQYDNLKVILKVAEKESNVIVEETHEGCARGRAQRLLERLKGVVMWILVIVLLNTVPGLDKIMKLETYATSQECQIERNRIGYEMAAAYPYNRDFVIACQLSPKHDS